MIYTDPHPHTQDTDKLHGWKWLYWSGLYLVCLFTGSLER